MMLRISVSSETGYYREINEDSYFAPQESPLYCCVADGMGGHNAGEVASALACRIFSEDMSSDEFEIGDRLYNAVKHANFEIYKAAKADKEKSGMGTTMTAIAVDGSVLYVAHVGDSRLYMLRNGKLFQVTSDHSYVAELVERGEITKEEARVHPQRNMITRALGLSRSVKVDLLKLRLHGGELFLLCTDGLSGVLTNDELKKMLEKEQPLDEKAPALVKKALENGSSDNVTAMLVKVEGEPA